MQRGRNIDEFIKIVHLVTSFCPFARWQVWIWRFKKAVQTKLRQPFSACLLKIQNGRHKKIENQKRTINWVTDMCNTSSNMFWVVTNPFLPSKQNIKVIFKVKSNMAAKKKSSKSEITLPWTTDMFNTSLNRFFGVTSPFLPSKKNLKIIFKVNAIWPSQNSQKLENHLYIGLQMCPVPH